MNEDFVTYELAVKLKEKGFNEPCYGYYHCNGGNDSFEVCGNGDCDFLNSKNKHRIAAPTIPQVLKWLREEKKIYIVIAVNPTLSTKDKIAYYYQVYSNSNGVTSDYYESEDCYAQWEDCAIGSIKSVFKYLIKL
jgi:hypothetical protein